MRSRSSFETDTRNSMQDRSPSGRTQTVAPRRARQWPACCFASVAGRAEQKVRTASVRAAAMRD